MDWRIFHHMNEIELLKQLGDPTRLRSLILLLAEGELCVCELTHALDLSQPKISRHLAQLRQAGLVQDRRAGHWIHYRLHDGLPGWVNDLLQRLYQEVRQREPYYHDLLALQAMPNRPGAACCA